MKPNLQLSNTLISLTMILATTIRLPPICSQKTQPHNIRGRLVQFENVQLGCLFLVPACPTYYDHSGFQLSYLSNVCIHNYQSLDYQFLGTNNCMQTTIISRNDYWSNFFPQFLYTTTYNSTLISGNNFNVSLPYECDSNVLRVVLGSNYEFNYNVNGLGMNSSMRTITIAREDTWSNFFPRCLYTTTYNSKLFNGNNFGHKDISLYHECDSSLPKLLLGSNYDFSFHVNYTHRLASNRMAGFNLKWAANSKIRFQYLRLSSNLCESNSTSSELFACCCGHENFSLACNNSDNSGGFKRTARKSSYKRKLVIGYSCGSAGIMLLLLVILYQKRKLRKTQKATNHQVEMFLRNCRTLAPKRYKYAEIKRLTNSFQVKLGQGGYGSVYKGKLPDGHLVAVKLLGETTGDGEDFFNEVASISRTSHVNVVTLLGFCIEGKKRALVYEFMPNGSLDKFLCGDGACLDWNILFKIAKGIARGLEYLHQGCNTRIVHFDIKPHNILLDEEFVPKVSDFGMAKLCTRKESILSVMGARGTAGYMAPEVFLKSFGGPSHKSDVYSYGMVVLEMTGAHKNNNASVTSTSETYFPDWIYKLLEAGDNLGAYGATTGEEHDLAKKMIVVSLWCIQPSPWDRPSISKVVEMLEGNLQSLQVPPRHFLLSPRLPSQAISSLAIESSIKERVLTVHTTDEDLSS